jgi:hypothetical protein
MAHVGGALRCGLHAPGKPPQRLNAVSAADDEGGRPWLRAGPQPVRNRVPLFSGRQPVAVCVRVDIDMRKFQRGQIFRPRLLCHFRCGVRLIVDIGLSDPTVDPGLSLLDIRKCAGGNFAIAVRDNGGKRPRPRGP